jgi:hypothetical protein
MMELEQHTALLFLDAPYKEVWWLTGSQCLQKTTSHSPNITQHKNKAVRQHSVMQGLYVK